MTTAGAGMQGDGFEHAPARTRSGIGESLAALMEIGQVFEIRAFYPDGRVSSGYFDDAATAATAIEPLDGIADGIYFTPNPVDPDLLARRANRMKISTKKDSSTSDGDIVRRRWLLIDVDPVRPSGVSASDAEHEAALRLAREIAEGLGILGWPEPIMADSGNGAHLLYRIDLPNDEKSTALVKATLAALDVLYSNEKAKVDTGVFNASRIWKVYGTIAKKGDHVPNRPHRRAALCSVPDDCEVLTRAQLATVAMRVPSVDPAPQPPRGAGDALDLGSWLRNHGVGVSSEKPYQGGMLYNLDSCPFSSAHRDGAYAIQFPSGAIHAGCKHDSCGSGNQRWTELREMFEGPRKVPVQRATTPPQVRQDAASADYLSLVTDGKFGRRLDPSAVADHIHERLHTLSFNETIYCYRDGIYHENRGEVQALVKTISDETQCREALTKSTREVMHHLTYLNPHEEYPFNCRSDLIPVANGVLRLDYETGAADLLEHSPEYCFTFKLPGIYDPGASPKTATDLLSQYVVPEDVPLLFQVFAQALLQSQIDKSYKKSYLLQGDPNAGKSTYIVISDGFFGRDNISHVSLQAIGTDRFCKGKMEGKLVNCYDDLSDIPLENIGEFKNLTGATFHGIEVKFKQGYEGRIFCVHVFTCNRPPRVPEDARMDAAFWERWEYIRFPYSFPVDPDFYARTLTPAFFSSLLAGVVEMMLEIKKRGRLTVNRTATEVMQRWTVLADPLAQFIDANMQPLQSVMSDFDKTTLWNNYLTWCDIARIDHRLRLTSISGLTRGLIGLGIVEVRTSTTKDTNDKRPRSYDVYRGKFRWIGGANYDDPTLGDNRKFGGDSE